MNSPKVSYFSKTLLSLLFIAGLILTPNLMRAQEQSDEEKEYKQLEDTKAENDAVQKADMAIKFLKEKPKSTYKQYFVTEYQKGMIELQKEKKWAQVIAIGEKYISIAPDDSITVKAMAAAYASTNNVKGFATFGEKAFPSAPSAELALQIAKAYKEAGNDAKYQQWAEKTLSMDPNNVDLLAEMVRKKSAVNDMAQASKYATACLKALAALKRPETPEDKGNYAICYATLGAVAYQNQKYAEAIRQLESAVKYYKRMDVAYLTLGMCYWQTGKIAIAELNFAKAVVIKGPAAAQAKKQLEKLWSDMHKGSLKGLELVYQRAENELK
jgi:tetratricopeptide (TPR) repeat protein